MKRAPDLRELSVQHHYGLVAARRLRQAAEGKEPLVESVKLFLEEWEREIQPHFRAEEEILLPEFARVAPPDDPLIVRTLTEHVTLRRAVRALRQATEAALPALAREIGRRLDEHIRFEERVLYPAVEAALEGALLKQLGLELASNSQQAADRCRL